jgi:NAD(P)-dependent dehydrogenase (short-subunit alcohol dehydrogenase family)
MARWTTADIPDQRGRTVVVTGTGGLGYETALALARAGADVVIAGRSTEKGRAAIAKIGAAMPGAHVRFELLDLASLASVAAFGDRMQGGAIDLLVNNAGVMAPPARRATSDGFELQLGTNYLGHFALTARLLPALRRGRGARVVSVASIAHRRGRIAFEDLQSERSYQPWAAYAQSKLAMLMFALELQRRSDAAGWGVMSCAAHPGIARTDLFGNGPGSGGIIALLGRLPVPLVNQSAAQGALPILFAATSPGAVGGGYYGPDGVREMTGWPRVAAIRPQALDRAAAARLWDESLRLTGVAFG